MSIYMNKKHFKRINIIKTFINIYIQLIYIYILRYIFNIK